MQIIFTVANLRVTVTLLKITITHSKKKSPTQKPTQSNSQITIILNHIK